MAIKRLAVPAAQPHVTKHGESDQELGKSGPAVGVASEKSRLDVLSPEQRDALIEFRRQHGRQWKQALHSGWERAAYPGPLQQIRNQQGPAWLNSLTPADFPAEPEPAMADSVERGVSTGLADVQERAPRATAEARRGGGDAKGKGDAKRRDLYQEVTDQMIQAIEEGTAPWQQPWQGRFGWPENPTTGKPYHGINILLLSKAGFQDPRWCSYEQAKKKGWQVRGGEKASRIYFYKPLHKETDELDLVSGLPVVKTVPVFRSYPVFNLSQMDNAPKLETGIDHKVVLDDVTEQAILDIIEAIGVEVVSGRTRAAYSPKEDQIFMPDKSTFKSDAHYYAALLHELAHWTGHESRLNRPFSFDRESEAYAREELRAEMASAMLSMQLGIPAGSENHEGYVAAYLKMLRDDKKEVFRAAKDAETISRFILRYSPDLKERLEEEVRDQAQAAADAGAPDEFFDASLFEDFEPETPSFRP